MRPTFFAVPKIMAAGMAALSVIGLASSSCSPPDAERVSPTPTSVGIRFASLSKKTPTTRDLVGKWAQVSDSPPDWPFPDLGTSNGLSLMVLYDDGTLAWGSVPRSAGHTNIERPYAGTWEVYRTGRLYLEHIGSQNSWRVFYEYRLEGDRLLLRYIDFSLRQEGLDRVPGEWIRVR